MFTYVDCGSFLREFRDDLRRVCHIMICELCPIIISWSPNMWGKIMAFIPHQLWVLVFCELSCLPMLIVEVSFMSWWLKGNYQVIICDFSPTIISGSSNVWRGDCCVYFTSIVDNVGDLYIKIYIYVNRKALFLQFFFRLRKINDIYYEFLLGVLSPFWRRHVTLITSFF